SGLTGNDEDAVVTEEDELRIDAAVVGKTGVEALAVGSRAADRAVIERFAERFARFPILLQKERCLAREVIGRRIDSDGRIRRGRGSMAPEDRAEEISEVGAIDRARIVDV